jgi:hypothetical protein
MDISRIVLALRPDPDVVGRTVAQIFHNIEHESADPERREALEAFFRELSRLVINWMAGSDQTVLRAVHSRIVEALGKLPPSHPANRYLSDGEWLGVRLRGLAVLVSTYLTTVNLAKSLGPLSGRRRESWRRAVEWMASIRRPIRTGELVAHGVFKNDNTANNALHKLVEYGLLERRNEGASVTFSLTWAGENVARFLQSAGAEEGALNDQRDAVVPPSELADWRAKLKRKMSRGEQSADKEPAIAA